MEVSGHFHAPAAFPLKVTQQPLDRGLSELRAEENRLVPCRESNPDYSVVHPAV
jgi:hypothetical protein